jgi:hypothetical protein
VTPLRSAVSLVACLLAASLFAGCGDGFSGGDCSGGEPDDGGFCIPTRHAPARVEASAAAHFRTEELQVDRVACYARREFHRVGRKFTVWGCVRVAGGDAKENDEVVCIPSSNGRPIDDSMRATLPAGLLTCAP